MRSTDRIEHTVDDRWEVVAEPFGELTRSRPVSSQRSADRVPQVPQLVPPRAAGGW
ncbi:MAG TPA: hypothetical protein VFM55_05295 [Micromonosporaceae bacterium]|nr:hypothetical protein [Micromonosporaceae bacterium]